VPQRRGRCRPENPAGAKATHKGRIGRTHQRPDGRLCARESLRRFASEWSVNPADLSPSSSPNARPHGLSTYLRVSGGYNVVETSDAPGSHQVYDIDVAVDVAFSDIVYRSP